MHITNKNIYPQISVCMPVYNRAIYMRECIDSILAQTFTDFELLIVDDGSTDTSCDIIKAYKDPRIRLIENKHNFIESLNTLLEEAKGKYIARMDSDDIMIEDRLESQYKYMEANPDVDVLGGGIDFFGLQDYPAYYPVENVTVHDMINGCCIVHPTAMIRRSIFSQYNFKYRSEFIYAEDYGLWCEMLRYNIKFKNLNKILIKYRTSETQVTYKNSDIQSETANKIRTDFMNWVLNKEKEVSEEQVFIKDTNKKLTVVIPFLNEGEEVINTVRSARKTGGDNFDIIIVNDCSDNDYNYEEELKPYNVNYIYNTYRIGAAASKEKGVFLTKTPFFLLLDAHMRFYDSNWPNIIVQYLEKDDNQLLCCQTKVLRKKDGVVFESETKDTYGAFLSFKHDGYMPGIHWASYQSDILSSGQIASVLGAGYAASRRYWNYIRGLQGLLHYGSEEAYLSIKSWLFGGGCRLLSEVKIGHIYKQTFNYKVYIDQMKFNNLFIAETLFPISLRCLSKSIAYKQDKTLYLRTDQWLKSTSKRTKELREYYSSIPKKNFEFILSINDLPSKEELNELKENSKKLLDFLVFIDENASNQDIGLMNGIAGQIVVYCLYAELFDDKKWENKASKLFNAICDSIKTELPVSFGKGLCGIGWAILYLQSHSLLEDPMEEELQLIDQLIMERSPLRMKDLSLISGLGGVLCYVTARLGSLEKEGKISLFFNESYLSELEIASRSLLNTTDDYRCCNFAMQLLEYINKKEKREIIPLEFDEILELPKFLPQQNKYWEIGLLGVTGYAVRILSDFKKHKIN